MTVLIEDSPRNLLAWITDAVQRGLADGAVITPFATPRVRRPQRRDAREMAGQLQQLGAHAWFDPATHALQMPNVGDFRYYDDYDLWGGAVGDLSTAAEREDHVRRVFEVQDRLAVPHLAPTILLHTAQSSTSRMALELAQGAVGEDPACWLSIVGTSSFWAGGSQLDAHIGALAQLQPAGWFATVARPLAVLPVASEREEVHGLCRTARALAEDGPVHVSHGDLAALPALAAGATSLGTGWDQRQRACSFPSYAARDPNAEGGGWYERPTFRGLCGSLKRQEAELVRAQGGTRCEQLVPGPLPAPGPKEAYLHHLGALRSLISPLAAEQDPRARYEILRSAYATAQAEWPAIAAMAGSGLGASEWVDALADGLRDYGRTEGW